MNNQLLFRLWGVGILNPNNIVQELKKNTSMYGTMHLEITVIMMNLALREVGGKFLMIESQLTFLTKKRMLNMTT
jgi:hypothetical protein